MTSPLVRFDPAFRAALVALADQAEANLGLSGIRLTMVCHACRNSDNGAVYEASLVSVPGTAHLKEMRRGFPRRGYGGQQFYINEFGALFLVNVTLADIEAARRVITPA